MRVANWVEEEYGSHLLGGEAGAAATAAMQDPRTVTQSSFEAPPANSHLTHRGVPSDTAHACVDKDMLFFHG